MILQIVFQIILPLVMLVGLWRERGARRLQWLLHVMAVGAVILFVFVTARWDFTSYYLRYAWPVLLIAAACRSYPRSTGGTMRSDGSRIAVSAILCVAFLGLAAVALLGYIAPEQTLRLAYPLRDGVYYVGGGGNARLINNHQIHPSQRFALDIVRLNGFGNRASGLAPTELERYAIFGAPVYSPCAGTVVAAVDGLPDLRPPQRDRAHLAGNHVVLACADAKVVLAHLKQHSVGVAAGAEVQVGDVLGQVGNSGNTSQPHLHLHAERGGADGEILTGQGVPIELGGRFLVRNSLFGRR